MRILIITSFLGNFATVFLYFEALKRQAIVTSGRRKMACVHKIVIVQNVYLFMYDHIRFLL